MNNKFKTLALFAMLLSWSGCSDDNEVTPDEPKQEVDIEISQGEVGEESIVFATSAVFNLNLSGVESFVYEVKPGKQTTMPDPAVMYANATAEGGSGVITAVAGANEVKVEGLEADTEYTIFFAFKHGVEYSVQKQEFETNEYNKLVNVIKVGKDGFDFYLNASENQYFKLGVMGAEDYYSMRDMFGQTDASLLSHSSTYKGGQKIRLRNGERVDPNNPDSEDLYQTFYPGGTYILLIGECDKDGKLLYELNEQQMPDIGGGALSQSIEGQLINYTEEYTDDDATFTGAFAKLKLWTEFPEVVENKAQVSVLKKTEKTVVFSVIPDKVVHDYGAIIFTEDEYNMMKEWVGEKGIHSFVFYASQQFSGNQEISYENLSVGTKYKFFVISNYNDDYTKQSFYMQDIEITPSTKPECVLEIKPGEADQNDFYNVYFNIKAPNADCYGVRYLANYKADWDSAPSDDDMAMIQQYGKNVEDSKIIDAINSPEGYTMKFASRPNETTILKLVSYNVDEAVSKTIYEGTATSLEESGTPIANRALFDLITGTWDVTYKYRKTKNGEDLDATFPIVFTQKAEKAPAEIPADVRAELKKYFMNSGNTEAEAEARIDEYYNDYKESAERYSTKYNDLNRIVGHGFDYVHAYKGAWDLFCDMNYSAATTDELFYDFGPKIFLQLKEIDGEIQVALATYQDAIPPMSSGVSYRDYYMLGNNVEITNSGFQNLTYPVKVEDGKDGAPAKMYIQGLMDSELVDKPIFPTVGYYMNGFPFFQGFTTQAIELTKRNEEEGLGVLAPAAPESRFGAYGSVKPISTVRSGNRWMRTYIPNERTAVKFGKAEVEYMPLYEMLKSKQSAFKK